MRHGAPLLAAILATGFVLAHLNSTRLNAFSASSMRAGPEPQAPSTGTSPSVGMSTFLGGTGQDEIVGIAFDAAGNVYVLGNTTSPNLPVTPSAFQKTVSGSHEHAFVAKFNTTATAILYLTYLGGSGFDYGSDIAVDSAGNAYVVGTTDSRDFPVTPGAVQTRFGGADIFGDAFITKLDPTGSRLIYSTYLGGGKDDLASSIALDAAGNAYVAGLTRSRSFPVTSGAFQPVYGGGDENYSGSGGDGFVAKIDASGTALLYSTFLGGSDEDGTAMIRVDAAGNALVVGGTNSRNFPVTLGTVQPVFAGSSGRGRDEGDAFVAKLNALGTGLIFSTFLGGSAADKASSVAFDGVGNIYVQGYTSSPDFPTYHPLQATLAGQHDAFLVKLDPAATVLLYSTHFGINNGTIGFVDASGYVYLAGDTDSPQFPLLHAFRPYFGNTDLFVAKVAPEGDTLLYSTYLGGSDLDLAYAMMRHSSGDLWIAGSTFSQNFPVASALQPSMGGGMSDAFLTRIAEVPTPDEIEMADLTITLTADRTSVSNGDSLHYTLTVTNQGPAAAENVLLMQLVPDPLTFISATAAQAPCSGGPYVSCNLGTLSPAQTANATITAAVPRESAISLGQALVATAAATSSTADRNLSDNSAQATVNVTIHGSGGGSIGVSGCFVATAAYGSYLDPHVRALRDFRDRHLLNHAAGRTLVRFYYHHSPAVAAVIERSRVLRSATRLLLTPIVFAIEYPGRSAALVFFCCVITVVIIVRRRARKPRSAGRLAE